MLWAIFSTFLSSISKVFFKKTTQYDIKPELNDFFGYIGAIFGIVIIFFVSDINLLLHSFIDYFLILLTVIFFLITVRLNHYVIRQEKVSALIPYENLGKVLIVLSGVFILKDDISTLSFILFLCVIGVIILFSVDFKKLTFSKNIGIYCITQIVVAASNITIGYILINNNAVDFYIIYIIFSVLIVTFLCTYLLYFKDSNKLDKGYYINRGLSSLNWIGWIISILLIKDLGLSVTTLLSFLGIAISLITSYIVFKDIPSKKNLLMTILILSFVGLGYYFR